MIQKEDSFEPSLLLNLATKVKMKNLAGKKDAKKRQATKKKIRSNR